MSRSWSNVLVILLCATFVSLLYLTFMEKNSTSANYIKEVADQMKSAVERLESKSEILLKEKEERNYSKENIETDHPLQQENQHQQQPQQKHLQQHSYEVGNEDYLITNSLQETSMEGSENVVMEEKISEVTMNTTLQSLSLEILKEVSGTTYEKLMEAALQAKPISSRPRPRSMQIIIATTWRSGSTFLEELIESHPGMYNHYEPLLVYEIRSFYNEDEPDAQDAQNIIHDLLKCRYSDDYIDKAKKASIELFSRNQKLWSSCKNKKNKNALCFQKKFLEAACHIFPWTLMKLVRMGVNLLRPLLEDNSLNVHVLYLVRDPRAVTHSRLTSVHWCHTRLCNDPSILCEHMEDDYKAVNELQTLFPGRVHMIRYEDMSLSPFNVTQKLLKALDLDFDPAMEDFISTHTTINYDKPWSTSRESSKRVSHWTTKIKDSVLDEVQSTCSNIMQTLGYKLAKTTKNLTINDILEPLNVSMNIS